MQLHQSRPDWSMDASSRFLSDFNLKTLYNSNYMSLVRIDAEELIKYSELSMLQKHRFKGGKDSLSLAQNTGLFNQSAFSNYLCSKHSIYGSVRGMFNQITYDQKSLPTSAQGKVKPTIFHSEVLELISNALNWEESRIAI